MYRDHIISSLSFAKSGPDDTVVFDLSDAGSDWNAGCQVGKGYADDLTHFIRENSDTVILSRVLAALTAGGELHDNPVAVGMLQRLSEYLLMGQ